MTSWPSNQSPNVYERQVVAGALLIGAIAAAVVAIVLGLAVLLNVPLSLGMAIRLVVITWVVMVMSIYAFTYIPTTTEMASWQRTRLPVSDGAQALYSARKPMELSQRPPTILCADQLKRLPFTVAGNAN